MSLNRAANRPPPPPIQRSGSVSLPSNFVTPSFALSATPSALGKLASNVPSAQGGSSNGDLSNSTYNLTSRSFLNEFLVTPEVEPPPVFGHDVAKKFLTESCVIPVLYPSMKSWAGVLLFGPAGVGKSSLVKSIVYDLNSKYPGKIMVHFFSCSASSIVNKYRGESEKILKGVFECAREIRPEHIGKYDDGAKTISIIFIDELDSVFSSTANDEGSARLRVELLKHIDGVESGRSTNRVIVVGATNLPADLGEALVRRFEKRCYISLPDSVQRRHMIDYHMKDIKVASDVDLDAVVEQTEGLSGADLKVMCREAAMGSVRRFLSGVKPQDFSKEDLEGISKDMLSDTEVEDFVRSVENTRMTVNPETLTHLEQFDERYGSR
mmetsp:Transcript_24420/g.50760  ORF Transcript_24420/g.50760 Transcript_24420/m.50760 type:complete len:381 (-) Transcript_24420:20-1162(-)